MTTPVNLAREPGCACALKAGDFELRTQPYHDELSAPARQHTRALTRANANDRADSYVRAYSYVRFGRILPPMGTQGGGHEAGVGGGGLERRGLVQAQAQ